MRVSGPSGLWQRTSQRPLRSVWLRAAFLVVVGAAAGMLLALLNGPSGSAATSPTDGASQRSAPDGAAADGRPARSAEIGVVRTQRAAIRQAPSASADAVCVARQGAQLLVDGKRGGWCRVRMAQGAACYVARSQIRLTGVLVCQEAEEPEPPGRLDVVAEAQRHVGIAYVWGGASASGADCSGFVQMVFARCGTRLPRGAGAQADVGAPVLATELRPGDRIYFRSARGAIDHTGIYVGDRRFIHASGRHGAVVISRLDDPYYARRYAFTRR